MIFFFSNLGLKGSVGKPGIPGPKGLKGDTGMDGMPGKIAQPGTNNKTIYYVKIIIRLMYNLNISVLICVLHIF